MRVHPIRGYAPGVSNSPLGVTRGGKKTKARTGAKALAKRVRNPAIAKLDEAYRAFRKSEPRNPRKMMSEIVRQRALDSGLTIEALRERYPELYAAMDINVPASAPPPMIASVEEVAPLPVPTPAERLAPVLSAPSRPGQTAFRADVIAAYGRCAVTGCKIETVLDAAHIIPFVDERSNIISNALCLRTDIHRLFDADLIRVGDDYVLALDANLAGTSYASLEGQRLKLPNSERALPCLRLLKVRGLYL